MKIASAAVFVFEGYCITGGGKYGGNYASWNPGKEL